MRGAGPAGVVVAAAGVCAAARPITTGTDDTIPIIAALVTIDVVNARFMERPPVISSPLSRPG
jgi:sensor domain CHASE-containing protein